MKFQQLLKDKGFTRGTLAKAIGVGRQAVYQWSWGKCAPDPETILKIKDILQVSAEEVLLCLVKDKGGKL